MTRESEERKALIVAATRGLDYDHKEALFFMSQYSHFKDALRLLQWLDELGLIEPDLYDIIEQKINIYYQDRALQEFSLYMKESEDPAGIVGPWTTLRGMDKETLKPIYSKIPPKTISEILDIEEIGINGHNSTDVQGLGPLESAGDLSHNLNQIEPEE